VGDYDVSDYRLEVLAKTCARHSPEVAVLYDTTLEVAADWKANRNKSGFWGIAVKQAMEGVLIGNQALELLQRDIGPNNKSEIAITAMGALKRWGYKMWGVDFGKIDNGAEMGEAIHNTERTGYGTLELLRHGSESTRRKILKAALSDLRRELADKLEKTGLDERLHPVVTWIMDQAAVAQ